MFLWMQEDQNNLGSYLNTFSLQGERLETCKHLLVCVSPQGMSAVLENGCVVAFMTLRCRVQET